MYDLRGNDWTRIVVCHPQICTGEGSQEVVAGLLEGRVGGHGVQHLGIKHYRSGLRLPCQYPRIYPYEPNEFSQKKIMVLVIQPGEHRMF